MRHVVITNTMSKTTDASSLLSKIFPDCERIRLSADQVSLDGINKTISNEIENDESVYFVFDRILDVLESDEEIQEIIARAAVVGAGGCVITGSNPARVADLCVMTSGILGADTSHEEHDGFVLTFISKVVPESDRAQLANAGASSPVVETSQSLIDSMEQALLQRVPLSMVRLGHCEARFIGFEKYFTKNAVLISTRMQWGLKEFPTEELRWLSAEVRGSAESADYIGVPKPNGRFGRFLLLNNAIYAEAKELSLFKGEKRFLSANVHWEIGKDRDFFRVLNGQGRIVLITSRDVQSKLHSYLDGVFGARSRDIETIPLPAEFRRSYQSYNERRYPDAFQRILSALPKKVAPGDLVLVGAGIMGKIFCARVRELGGVALDLGSLFDAWEGLNTRGSGFEEGLRLPPVPKGWRPKAESVRESQVASTEALDDQDTPSENSLRGASDPNSGSRNGGGLPTATVPRPPTSVKVLEVIRRLYRSVPAGIRKRVPRRAINWISRQFDRSSTLPDFIAKHLAGRRQLAPAGQLPQYHTSTFTDVRPYAALTEERLTQMEQEYCFARQSSEAKASIAVFSAVTGAYEPVKRHEHLLHQADYFVFSDDAQQSVNGPYHFRRSEYWAEDSTRAARYVKLHPHLYLEGYKIAVWVDGNVIIRGDISGMIAAFAASGEAVGAVPHPLRTSVYEEAAECIRRQKDIVSEITEQLSRYKADGFDCEDLAETNLLMFNLEHPALQQFMDFWWAEIERGSRRDQLSFNYALRARGLSYYRLTERPNSVRNHPELALFAHDAKVPGQLVLKPSALGGEGDRTGARFSNARDAVVGSMRGTRIDIGICVHNALLDVKNCLASVERSKAGSDQRVIIVDDGSGSETSEYLRIYAEKNLDVTLLRNDVPRGYTKAANQCLAESDAPFLIMLNSDTVVTWAWAEKLAHLALTTPGVGIVGPLSNAASQQSIPEYRSSREQTVINELPAGWTPERVNSLCEDHAPLHAVVRTSLAHGFCLGIKREVIEAIGTFDEERFPNGYGEENDYCFRAMDAGFSCAIATNTYIWHAKSRSYSDERRRALVSVGNETVQRTYGRARVARAIRSMQQNPVLEDMRSMARLHLSE